MLKKLLSCGVIIALLVAMISVSDVSVMAAGDIHSDDGYVYTVDIDGNAEITDYDGIGGVITIPDKINGHNVSKIGPNAFEGCSSITGVNLPESLISVGLYAFAGTQITYVKIPKSVTSLRSWGDEHASAFTGCKTLETIEFEAGIKVIPGSSAIGVTSLKNVIIPEGVTSIGIYAFWDCNSLVDISIPDTIITIEAKAFLNCSFIEKISLKNNVKKIGMQAFMNCTSLKNIDFGSSLETISEEAFLGCSSITALSLPDSLKAIELNAFSGSQITYVKIPRGVTSLRSWGDEHASAFTGCNKLETVEFAAGLKAIPGSSVVNVSSLKRVIIPEGATLIGAEAFYGDENLTRVILPSTITTVENDAFYGCTNLTVYGHEGTYADTYSNESNISFKVIDGDNFYTDVITGTLQDINTTIAVVMINGNDYTVGKTVNMDSISDILNNHANKVVIAILKNNEIISLDDISEIVYPEIKMSSDTSKISYKNGKMNISSFTGKADISCLVKSPYKIGDLDGLTVKSSAILAIDKFNLSTLNDCLSFENNAVIECAANLKPGESKEISFNVYVNKNYVPESAMQSISIFGIIKNSNKEYSDSLSIDIENADFNDDHPVQTPTASPEPKPVASSVPTPVASPVPTPAAVQLVNQVQSLTPAPVNVSTKCKIPAKGVKLHDKKNNAYYRVTCSHAKKGEVEYLKPDNKKVKSVIIPAKVKIKGITYKVTGIAANAFKGCKKLKKVSIKAKKLKKSNIRKKAFKGIKAKIKI